MRKEKELMALLRGLVDLIAEEATRNPHFEDKLGYLLNAVPTRRDLARRTRREKAPTLLPDLHAEYAARGEDEFRLWLRDLSTPMLRALIRANDFDTTGRTRKWKEAEKLAAFIADGLRARLSRGAAFMSRGQTNE
jgi:hypothetical protein